MERALGEMPARLLAARTVLSALFRRLMLAKVAAAHKAGKLTFFGELGRLADEAAFKAYLAPLRTTDWFVYSKRPLSGPSPISPIRPPLAVEKRLFRRERPYKSTPVSTKRAAAPTCPVAGAVIF